MTNEEVKNYLEQIRHINKNIQAKLMQLEQLRAQTENTVSAIKQNVVQSNKGNGFSDASDRIIDIQTKLKDDIEVQNQVLADIHKRLDLMFKDYPGLTNLLYLRYVNSLNWMQICVELNYSWRQIHERHNLALKTFKNYVV